MYASHAIAKCSKCVNQLNNFFFKYIFNPSVVCTFTITCVYSLSLPSGALTMENMAAGFQTLLSLCLKASLFFLFFSLIFSLCVSVCLNLKEDSVHWFELAMDPVFMSNLSTWVQPREIEHLRLLFLYYSKMICSSGDCCCTIVDMFSLAAFELCTPCVKHWQ